MTGQLALDLDYLPRPQFAAFAVFHSVRPTAIGRPIVTVHLTGTHLATGCVRCQQDDCACAHLFGEADARADGAA